MGARKLTFTVVGVSEREVALRDTEPVTNSLELGMRGHQEFTCTGRRSPRLLDESLKDEALRATQHVAYLKKFFSRLVQHLEAARVVTEQVVDLSNQDFTLCLAGEVVVLLEVRMSAGDEASTLRRRPEIRRDVTKETEALRFVDLIAVISKRATSDLGFTARLVECTRVATCLGTPPELVGEVHAREFIVQQGQVTERGARVAHLAP